MYTDALRPLDAMQSHVTVTWTAEEHVVKFKVESNSGLAVRQQC